jgi:hypothetical protein
MKTKMLALFLFVLFLTPITRAQTANLRYEGSWTNTTFGSFGAAHVGVVLDAPNATITFDLDGFVFGDPDPALIVVPGTIAQGVLHLDSKGVATYGDVVGTINLVTGETLIDVTNVPNPRIKRLQLTGNVTGKIDLQYTVEFPEPPSAFNPAKGVLVAEPVPQLQITSVQQLNGELIVTWAGGKPPYQIQTRPDFSPASWQNLGGGTSSTTAQIPVSNSKQLFVRVSGQ